MADARTALAISNSLTEAMGETLTLEPQTQTQIGFAVGPAGVLTPMTPPEQPTGGWRLRTSNGAWVVALLPDFFALECTGYTSWTDFRNRLDALCNAVAEHLNPAVEMRLGLRYVDRIHVDGVTDGTGWLGYIEPALLGPIGHETLGPSIAGTQQVVQLTAGDETQVLLRHGTQPDGETWPYTLDTDCSRQGSRPFAAAGLLTAAEELHRLSLQVFQACITPQLIGLLERATD